MAAGQGLFSFSIKLIAFIVHSLAINSHSTNLFASAIEYIKREWSRIINMGIWSDYAICII
eukprot:UN04693